MIIKLTEGNGLETYVYEPRLAVAMNMITFFKEEIQLEVQSMPDYEPMYSGTPFNFEENSVREGNYKNEYATFGKKKPVLYLVK